MWARSRSPTPSPFLRLPSIARLALVGAALTAATGALGAQVVLGTVTEQPAGAPLVGVLVTVEPAEPVGLDGESGTAVHALSDGSGHFAIHLPSAGTYVLSAKRIGGPRMRSAPIVLAEGETRRVDVALEPVAQTLPTVAVVETPMCVQRAEEAVRLASLWDEARTVLLATQITLQELNRPATVFRWVRYLEPEALRVLDETRAEVAGQLARSFVSLPAESLSTHGWWVQLDQSFTYHTPDASVLLSDSFVREHCFRLAESVEGDRRLVGLAFEPARGRRLPDISGTLWLDATSFELERLAYRYTRLPDGAAATGEMRFAPLSDGSWIVRRWFQRLPRYARYSTFEDAAFGRPHRTINTLKVQELVEEGGEVFAPELRLFRSPAVVEGSAEDSLGLPLTGGTVRLVGTPYTREVEADGRFRFDSLPAGAYTVVGEHPDYERFGIPAADSPVETVEGATREVVLRAATTSGMMARLCEAVPAPGLSVVRVRVLHRDSGEPLRQAPILLQWSERVVTPASSGVQQPTDGDGIVTFCDVPANVELRLRVVAPDSPPVAGATCRVVPGEVAAVRVSLYPPASAPASGAPPASCVRE